MYVWVRNICGWSIGGVTLSERFLSAYTVEEKTFDSVDTKHPSNLRFCRYTSARECTASCIDVRKVTIDARRVNIDVRRDNIDARRVNIDVRRVNIAVRRGTIDARRVNIDVRRAIRYSVD